MRIIVLFFSFIFALFGNSDIEVVDSFGKNSEIEVVQNVSLKEKSKNVKPIKKKVKKILKKSSIKKNPLIKKQKNFSVKTQNQKRKSNKTKNFKKNKKPKLVIIIDDISHTWQLKKIKLLGLKITPSIFPPNRMNMKSNLLAKGMKHFMVHLPLESHSKKMNKFYKTLFVSDSKKKVENRIKEIRKLFPNAIYINNHTGSLFSENYKASKQLYDILKKYGFIFVDSRTSHYSKFKKIAKEEKKHYLHSDIFIDDTQSIKYSFKMIKRAIAIAKRKGKAILIGHPHPTTFAALKKAKSLLKKEVEVVYIDELY